MLQIYRRHLKSCPHTSRSYRRCACPLWVQGTLGGETTRRALDVTSFDAASKLIAQWHAAGVIGGHKVEPPKIEVAVAKYLDDARARHLAQATITKLTTIFENQFLKFAKDHGYRFLKDLTPDRLTAWRSTWKDEALAASKKYQRVVGFFYFCTRMKWMSENPMKSLHPPKVKQDPTLPFTAEEVNAIVSACDRFPIKGIYGEGNRLRAMVLLLRYSGLRIRDAATLRRERIQGGKLLLYMQKTGVPVFVPLPPYVVAALDETPNVHPGHFFWSGNGLPKTTVADWQRSLRKLFELAKVSGAHAHRFRDTFAVELLLAGVPIDQVSVLLGHSSVKITEKSYAPWVKARQEQLEAAVMRTWPKLPRLAVAAAS
ncbi:MAG TPA: site-specific integrase [Thermoanaerobaculia bacterium]|jgi:integrase/recombinase XerD|nr:site-specific integrase [Thermoanaerobaculia bacterium]